MPIYVYRCKECNGVVEEIQKFSDSPLTICNSCNGKLEKQVAQRGAFRLAGPGWFKDGYQNSLGQDNKSLDKSAEQKSSNQNQKDDLKQEII